MRYLLAILACLTLGLWAYPSWSEPSFANPGGIGVGDVDVDGDVTADSFDTNPDFTLGGAVSLHECEGDTNCPAAGAGHTLRIALPDDEDPLLADRTIGPWHTVSWWYIHADIAAYLGGTYCIPVLLETGFTDNPLACSTLGNLSAGYYLNGPFTGGVWVDHCDIVHSVMSGTWATTETVTLQLQTVTAAGTIANIGSAFVLQADEDACGATPNCMNIDDLIGYWDVSGSSDVDGALQLRITSGTAVGTTTMRIRVDCKVY